jgi:hypothetical protein
VKISAKRISPPLATQLAEIEGQIAQDMTGIMKEEARDLTLVYRRQVTGAGMSTRLANTWRSQVYPKGGRALNPAGYIWSNAPLIIDSFTRGAVIRPVRGAKWLWIPTKNVPRARRGGAYKSNLSRKRGAGSAMGPEEVELHFNAELRLVFERGHGLAFIDVVRGVRGGYRQATAGRLKGRKGQAARPMKSILMFTLVKGVKMPRLFELQQPAYAAAQRVAARMNARWS